MIHALFALLAFQLACEAIARVLSLPVPGPVLGLIGLAIALQFSGVLRETVSDVAQGLLKHLSLLFVPAGVGVIAHAELVSTQAWVIMISLTVSTALTIAVTAAVFVGVRRAMRIDDEDDNNTRASVEETAH